MISPLPRASGLTPGSPRAHRYWLRYARPTHQPHADVEMVAVDAAVHGRRVGRTLTKALIADARRAGIEVLTLDARGGSANAHDYAGGDPISNYDLAGRSWFHKAWKK